MLVITRRRNEAVMIGSDLELIVLDIWGDRMRLGINHPSETTVRRKAAPDAGDERPEPDDDTGITSVFSIDGDETILIGDEIEVTYIYYRDHRVRLGIAAPARIPIQRREVYEASERKSQET